MNLQERLAQLRAQRAAQVTAMEAILGKANDEGRSFDETEQAGFDTAKGQISTIDVQIKNCEDMQTLLVKTATPVPGTGVDIGAGRVQVVRNLPKGTAFTRYAMALAAGKGNTMMAAEVAKNIWAKDTPEVEQVLRAAVAAGTTTDTNWAAPLAQYTNMASEFIELLQPMTFLGRMSGFRNVPFLTRMPRQTSGSTVGWVGQGAPKAVSKLQFDSVTIPHAKLAGIVAITEELARLSTPSAEATVRQDLLDTVAAFMDVQFVKPTIAAVSDVSPAAITNGATAANQTGATVATITADLNTAMTTMAVANVPFRSRYWLMHPRTENFLRTLRTSQDVFAFRDEMNGGKLLGIPFLSSSNMPLLDQSSPASGGSLESYIVLVEASEIFLADDGEVMLDVSREASLQMLDNPSSGAQSLVSLWQNNLVGIRAERYCYWKRRHDAGVYVIKNVAY